MTAARRMTHSHFGISVLTSMVTPKRMRKIPSAMFAILLSFSFCSLFVDQDKLVSLRAKHLIFTFTLARAGNPFALDDIHSPKAAETFPADAVTLHEFLFEFHSFLCSGSVLGVWPITSLMLARLALAVATLAVSRCALVDGEWLSEMTGAAKRMGGLLSYFSR